MGVYLRKVNKECHGSIMLYNRRGELGCWVKAGVVDRILSYLGLSKNVVIKVPDHYFYKE